MTYHIEPIPRSLMAAFVAAHHYAVRVPPHCLLSLGCFAGSDLVGVASWGYGVRPRHTIQRLFPSLTTSDYYELNRLCMLDSEPRNGESHFLRLCREYISEREPGRVVLFSWADGMRGNATKDWKPCLHLTERILTLPIAPSVRERIEGDVKSLRDNINAAQCFFCKRNSADGAAAVVVNMYGDVSETRTLSGTKVSWRQVPVRVPRCPLCKAAHRRASGWPWAGGGIGAVAGLMVGAAVGAAGGAAGKSSDSVCCGVFVGVVVLGAIGLAVGSAVGRSQLPAGVAPADRASGYSAVKELEGQGWHVGGKPPGVS